MFEDRQEFIKKLNAAQIPRKMVAAVCNLDRRRISDFVGYTVLREEESSKIKKAITDISFVWEVFQPYRVMFNNAEELEDMRQSAELVVQNRNKEANTA